MAFSKKVTSRVLTPLIIAGLGWLAWTSYLPVINEKIEKLRTANAQKKEQKYEKLEQKAGDAALRLQDVENEDLTYLLEKSQLQVKAARSREKLTNALTPQLQAHYGFSKNEIDSLREIALNNSIVLTDVLDALGWAAENGGLNRGWNYATKNFQKTCSAKYDVTRLSEEYTRMIALDACKRHVDKQNLQSAFDKIKNKNRALLKEFRRKTYSTEFLRTRPGFQIYSNVHKDLLKKTVEATPSLSDYKTSDESTKVFTANRAFGIFNSEKEMSALSKEINAARLTLPKEHQVGLNFIDFTRQEAKDEFFKAHGYMEAHYNNPAVRKKFVLANAKNSVVKGRRFQRGA